MLLILSCPLSSTPRIIQDSPSDAFQVDWALVAEKTGYNNAKVAQTRFGQIRKKVQEFVGENEQAARVKNGSPPKPPKSTQKPAESKDESPKTRFKAKPRQNLEDHWEEREDDSTEAKVKHEPSTEKETDSEDEELSQDSVVSDQDEEDWV